MEELFEVEESLSPWEAYKKEFDVEVKEQSEKDLKCLAQPHGFKWIAKRHGFETFGNTEEQAVQNLPIESYEYWRLKGGQNG